MRPHQTIAKINFIVFALSLALLGGCGGGKMLIPLNPAAVPPKTEYRIAPGDNLIIKLYYHPELNAEVWVRPDGFISLELVGEINRMWDEHHREEESPENSGRY